MPQTLKQTVEEALQAYSALRTSRPEIIVTEVEGVVTLTGYVPSASIRAMAGVLASTVEGVSEVINDLVAAPDLERAIAVALAADERTRSWPIRVRADLGIAQLQGRVPDEQAVQIALEVAHKVEGPKEIVSALKVARPEMLAA
jgi:osmotically-inducible protein OsmY